MPSAVATAGLTMQLTAKDYGVSSFLKSNRLPSMQLLHLLVEQGPQQQEATFHAAVATAWLTKILTSKGNLSYS